MSDLISRQDAIDAIQCAGKIGKQTCISILKRLPSAEPTEQVRTYVSLAECVSKKAAIDAAIEAVDEWDGGYNVARADKIISAIKKLPSTEPEQNWIPCSERLPKIGKEVLLSEPNAMFIAEYHGSGDSEGLWLVDGCYHYLADVNGCAWMPLPEPYKTGGNE